ncbi:type II pantothenate kinase [Sporothrix brasiliensis 5110]|uniref:Type II pantothenate kinase n=1 Tax=Sporothrix brasiliensis 5110 TaxID=1398154 RepID=A0A0C2IKB6_9PEZI|nr:type II pantothenate kinase [Sporothrix brasiliensis 5110]KIH87440.1 type II pantothenate kinase [Sporothrix brasiliensis 5110]
MADRAFDLAAAAAELQADPAARARKSPAEEDGDDGGGVSLARQLQTPSPSPLSTPRPQQASHTTSAPAPPPSTATHTDEVVPPRPRTSTSTAEIDSTIARPGPVRINVKGAFIVDEEPANGNGNGNGSANGSRSPTGSVRGADKRSQRTASGSSSDSAHGPASAPGRAHSPSEHHSTFDIRLPNHHAVVSHIAVDIGGTLAKVVFFSREAQSTEPGGRLNFTSFETDKIDDCIDFLLDLKQRHMDPENGARSSELCVMATGGGAYKYYDRIRARMGIDVLSEDEMECLIMGLDFFITEIPREVFTYSETDPMHFAAPSDDIYPYMLVNIGSGVSMLKVSGPHKYVRVGGTSLGGGTLWGLLSLLTGARSFDEMLELASRGDNSRVDMLVGDIYGTDYGKIGLKSTAIASSFGKVFRMKHLAETEAEDGVPSPTTTKDDSDKSATNNSTTADGPDGPDGPDNMYRGAAYNTHFSAADISRSLLYAISNNIGQIAYLQSQIHALDRIYFGGSFIQGHPQTMNTLSYAIKFWSKGTKQAYFLRHEGYLGAVGAFLKRQPRNWGRRGSFEGGLEMRMTERLREEQQRAGPLADE